MADVPTPSPAGEQPRDEELERLLARCLEELRTLELPELADALVEPAHDPDWHD